MSGSGVFPSDFQNNSPPLQLLTHRSRSMLAGKRLRERSQNNADHPRLDYFLPRAVLVGCFRILTMQLQRPRIQSSQGVECSKSRSRISLNWPTERFGGVVPNQLDSPRDCIPRWRVDSGNIQWSEDPN